MELIKTIYLRAGKVLAKKPVVLWGVSLLEGVLSTVFGILFGIIPGVSLCIGLLLSTSMTMIFLNGYRGKEVKAADLFICFKDWATVKRVLCGLGWMYLWVFLWALIPFVGWIFAIIRIYRYRLTPYILVYEPDVAITDAIKVSAERTKGFKGKMFGAEVLVYVAYGVVMLVLGILALIPYLGILFSLVSWIVGIVFALFSGLYIGLIQAAFYEEITAASVKRLCPKCEKEVAKTAEFCSHCGANLSE